MIEPMTVFDGLQWMAAGWVIFIPIMTIYRASVGGF